MKSLFLIFFISTLLFSEHISWQGDYEKSLIEAKRSSKNIVLLVLKKECIKCKSIFSEIFNQQEIEDKINKKYIPIVVFFEDKNSYPIELFYIQNFPALFFVSSKDELFLQEPLFGDFTKDEILKSL